MNLTQNSAAGYLKHYARDDYLHIKINQDTWSYVSSQESHIAHKCVIYSNC